MNDNNNKVDEFINSDIFCGDKKYGGSTNTKIRRFVTGEPIVKEPLNVKVICLVIADGEILYYIDSSKAADAIDIVNKFNPELNSYDLVFRPILNGLGSGQSTNPNILNYYLELTYPNKED